MPDGEPYNGGGGAIRREMREPTRTRLKTSRPRLSVPMTTGAVLEIEPGRLGKGVAEVDGDGIMRGQQGAEDGHECE